VPSQLAHTAAGLDASHNSYSMRASLAAVEHDRPGTNSSSSPAAGSMTGHRKPSAAKHAHSPGGVTPSSSSMHSLPTIQTSLPSQASPHTSSPTSVLTGHDSQNGLHRKPSVGMGQSISMLFKGLFKKSENGSPSFEGQEALQPLASHGSAKSAGTPGAPSSPPRPTASSVSKPFSLKAVFSSVPSTPAASAAAAHGGAKGSSGPLTVQGSTKSSTQLLENEVQAAMRRAASITGRQHAPSTLLAVAHDLPPKMARAVWSLRDYAVVEKMYTGYASNVYKAFCKLSGETVCLKSYSLSNLCELNRFQIFREVKLHSSLSHEHIIKLFGAFQQADQVVLVQEFADAGDLFTLLHRYGGRLPERTAAELVLYPFLAVIQYLHASGIAHRDIKPENILFTADMRLKLCDFGLAISLHEEKAVTRAGTLEYMAPEVLNCPFKNKPEENKDNQKLHYSFHVDTWAAGVLTYELLVGLPPFSDKQRTMVEDKIRQEMPKFPPKMSELAKDFITQALEKDPLARPTVMDMINHKWIRTLRRSASVRNLNAQRQQVVQAQVTPCSGNANHFVLSARASIPEVDESPSQASSGTLPILGQLGGASSSSISDSKKLAILTAKGGPMSAKSFTAGALPRGVFEAKPTAFDMSSVDVGMAKLLARQQAMAAKQQAATAMAAIR